MAKLILVFSHKLTRAQIMEAGLKLGLKDQLYLPDDLQRIWSNIDPEIEDLSSFIRKIEDFILSVYQAGDKVLVQGDFGATFQLVFRLMNQGIPCVYSTTRRVVEEVLDGDHVVKQSRFEHVRFRIYSK